MEIKNIGNATIRVGLIGMGSWPQESYIPILAKEPGVEILAVAARTEATLRLAQDLLGSKITLYNDYRELLANSDLNTVMIGVPPILSASAATAALEAKLHVWVEPPFVGVGNTTQMLMSAQTAKRVFYPNLELRCLPAVLALKKMIFDGSLGNLCSVTVNLGNNWSTQSAWENPVEGSLVYNLGPWYIDLIDTFIEQPPSKVKVHAVHRRYDGAVDTGTATLEFDGGVVGEFVLELRGKPNLELSVKIKGSGGEAESDLIKGTYKYRPSTGKWIYGNADCLRPIHGFVGMNESVQTFLSVIRGDTTSNSRLANLQRLQATLLAMLKSEREETEVSPEPKRE